MYCFALLCVNFPASRDRTVLRENTQQLRRYWNIFQGLCRSEDISGSALFSVGFVVKSSFFHREPKPFFPSVKNKPRVAVAALSSSVPQSCVLAAVCLETTRWLDKLVGESWLFAELETLSEAGLLTLSPSWDFLSLPCSGVAAHTGQLNRGTWGLLYHQINLVSLGCSGWFFLFSRWTFS